MSILIFYKCAIRLCVHVTFLYVDQKYFELEKQLIETQGDLNVQTELASGLKEQNIDLGT